MIKVTKEDFQNFYDGKQVCLYTVSNGKMSFSVTNFGGAITKILVPSKTGVLENVVLGYDSVHHYIRGNFCYFGVIAGRFANRIANSSFEIDGNKYFLDKNEGEHSLHGGFVGINRRVFDIEPVEIDEKLGGVKLSYLSKDGEQGMPGNLKINVFYLLDNENNLKIKYVVESDKKTPVNLTNHTYFNLSGDCKKNIFDTVLQISSEKILEVDDKLIPTGKFVSVENTPFDFRKPKKIGADIKKLKKGYDHNFCLVGDDYDGKLQQVSVVYEPKSGRKMTTFTTMPGVQVYTSGSLYTHYGYKGKKYKAYDGFCLETQFYPDAPNKPNFPNCVIEANKEYQYETVYKFEVC